MAKTLVELMYSGAAYVCNMAAMANICTTSLFMIYQPDMPCEKVVE